MSGSQPEAKAPASQRATRRRVPALVLSGFLGSGKTTVVQRLLADAAERGIRVALISNELGELGIDRALLGQGGESYVELEGGCVCCELSDDLLETLVALHRDVDPDRFVIETSGVALPYDTQLNFWREPACDFIGDDMAVVVVNAEQLAEGRDLEGTFEDQVAVRGSDDPQQGRSRARGGLAGDRGAASRDRARGAPGSVDSRRRRSRPALPAGSRRARPARPGAREPPPSSRAFRDQRMESRSGDLLRRDRVVSLQRWICCGPRASLRPTRARAWSRSSAGESRSASPTSLRPTRCSAGSS